MNTLKACSREAGKPQQPVPPEHASWIWLDETVFPDLQKTKATAFDTREVPYAVVRFRQKYHFPADVQLLRFSVSGDCRYRLFVNGEFQGMGPAFAGGDWARTAPMPQRYADSFAIPFSGAKLTLEAEVQLPPTLLCDISSGHGGFFLEGEAILCDRTAIPLLTDGTWQCRVEQAWQSDLSFDASLSPSPWMHARTAQKKLPQPSEIPLSACAILPLDENGELKEISAGILCCTIEADAPFEVKLIPYETPDLEDEAEIIRGASSLDYEGFRIRSVGGVRIETVTGSPHIRSLTVRTMKYPGEIEGECLSPLPELNEVLRVCEHTLSICRQSIHLDSPRHMEPLGCTGDYWIESLMEYYCYSDHRLTRFDLIRTARLLKETGGKMFHTGYSLMWISMLRDYILYTGDRAVLSETEESIRILLRRFQTYENVGGILDDPPDYMFADWVEIAGYSMHHPPKALGQTILNALYYRALSDAGCLLDDAGFLRRAASLKAAFERTFWVPDAGMFISGLTGDTPTNAWLPQNAQEPVFTLHANIMAVACKVCSGERARSVVRKALSDPSLPDYQPYFAHFVFQALWNTGLMSEFALQLFSRWIPLVQECPKGLAEGWIRPCDGYVFDHSHAWGGCPRYWLPRALAGLEILEPGFQTIRFSPRLPLPGTSRITIPTPCGLLKCTVTDGKITSLMIPPGISVVP